MFGLVVLVIDWAVWVGRDGFDFNDATEKETPSK